MSKLKEIQSYFESDAISQSFLKNFINDQPRSLFRETVTEDLYYKEYSHFVKGSLVDFLVTIKNEKLTDYYYIDDLLVKPSDTIKSIIHQLHDENCEFTEECLIQYARLQNYQPRWGDDAIVRELNKHKSYYNSLVNSTGKQIISKEEWDTSIRASEAIINGRFTKYLINDPNNVYQYAAYVEVDGVMFKGLLDILQINHDEKWFRIIDIKTTGDYLESFRNSIFRFRYDFQIAFYSWLVKYQYPDYNELDSIIIAVSMKEPDYAEPFLLLDDVYYVGQWGGYINNDKTKLVGFEEVLKYYKYYLANQNMYNTKLCGMGFNIITTSL